MTGLISSLPFVSSLEYTGLFPGRHVSLDDGPGCIFLISHYGLQKLSMVRLQSLIGS